MRNLYSRVFGLLGTKWGSEKYLSLIDDLGELPTELTNDGNVKTLIFTSSNLLLKLRQDVFEQFHFPTAYLSILGSLPEPVDDLPFGVGPTDTREMVRKRAHPHPFQTQTNDSLSSDTFKINQQILVFAYEGTELRLSSISVARSDLLQD